jgi:hypothetical protein
MIPISPLVDESSTQLEHVQNNWPRSRSNIRRALDTVLPNRAIGCSMTSMSSKKLS